MERLIIWDFDGVIADTERLWMQIELDVFNRYCGLDWDFATISKYLAGQAFSRQLEVLAGMGIYPPAQAMQEIGEKCYEVIEKGFERTKGIDDIFQLKGFKHAMGTGGDITETVLKVKAVGLEHIFTTDNVVTIDFVKQGKPAPDTFLLAAEIMGFKPENSMVIEDSTAGLIAAQRANMLPICYAGSEMYKNNDEHLKKVKDLGVEHIFFTMEEVRDFLTTL